MAAVRFRKAEVVLSQPWIGIFHRNLVFFAFLNESLMTHLKRQKLISSTQGPWIKSVYYIRGSELMKLIFSVLDVSLTMGLTRCFKNRRLLHQRL